MDKFTAIDIYDLYNRAAVLVSEIKNLHDAIGAAADSAPAAAEDLHTATDALSAALEALAAAPNALYKAHRIMYLEGADFNT